MKYPELVTKLTTFCDGWLIGSSANPFVTEPRDYDIFIPFSQWSKASAMIPRDAKINRMGGFKCISEGIEVDVWTGEMSDILANDKFTFALHPKTGVRICCHLPKKVELDLPWRNLSRIPDDTPIKNNLSTRVYHALLRSKIIEKDSTIKDLENKSISYLQKKVLGIGEFGAREIQGLCNRAGVELWP